MDVVGLPTAVQVALEALLTENRLTSWKVAAEGRSTVVVLRLTGPASPDMATRTTTDQRYRLKPPCQLRRDGKRAEQRANRQQEERQRQQQQQQQQQKASVSFSPTPLFSPTPEKKNQNEETNNEGSSTQCDTPVTQPSQHSAYSCAREKHEVQSTAGVKKSVSQPASDQCVTAPFHFIDVSGENVNNTETASEDVVYMYSEEGAEEGLVIENRAEQAGFCLDEIYHEVGQVMDRKIQNCLRDNQRNQRLFKTVLDTRHGMKVLVCESDEIVLRYDIDEQRVTHWYIRMRKKAYTELEHYSIHCLNRWPRVNEEEFGEELDRATADLNVLAAVVRLYLG